MQARAVAIAVLATIRLSHGAPQVLVLGARGFAQRGPVMFAVRLWHCRCGGRLNAPHRCFETHHRSGMHELPEHQIAQQQRDGETAMEEGRAHHPKTTHKPVKTQSWPIPVRSPVECRWRDNHCLLPPLDER